MQIIISIQNNMKQYIKTVESNVNWKPMCREVAVEHWEAEAFTLLRELHKL